MSKKNKKGLNRQGRSPKMVLICVLKNRRDLGILQKEHWYRIPASHAPVSKFNYLAFYQPKPFAPEDKRINYYTRVKSIRKIRREKLLPDEKKHPKAKELYLKIKVGNIMRLSPPIKNVAPRRISFGFTTHKKLRNAKNILEIYDIFPLEKIIGGELKKAGIKAIPQHFVKIKKRLPRGSSKARTFRGFRLDFAVYCKSGKIAIECDNQKAHSSPAQKIKDRLKNRLLRRDGWRVIRIREPEIIKNFTQSKAAGFSLRLKPSLCDGSPDQPSADLGPNDPIIRVKKAIQKLGGLARF